LSLKAPLGSANKVCIVLYCIITAIFRLSFRFSFSQNWNINGENDRKDQIITFVNLYNSIWICDYFSLQLQPNLSVSFINGLYCWMKAQFIPLAFLSAASESVPSKFGLIHLEKGEIFWRKTLTLLVELQRTKHNSTIKRPWAAELWTYPFVLEVQINFRESLHRFHGFNVFANCYQRNCTRRKCAAWRS